MKPSIVGVWVLAAWLSSETCKCGEIATFVEPYRDIDVACSEMGTLAYLNVKAGDEVRTGQVLAGLDESVLTAALAAAKAAKHATGRLASAKAELAMQRDRLEKIERLLTRRHASQEELDRARTQVSIAESQVQAVSEDLQIKAAEVARIEAQLDQKKIVSPINGIVIETLKDVGEFVSASDPVVAKIVQLDRLLAQFSVPQRSLGRLQRGQEVMVEVGASRSQRMGIVEFVSPVTDPQSNTIRVQIRIDNQGQLLHSGDSCWLTIDGDGDPLVSGQLVNKRPKTKSNRKPN